MDGLQRDGRLRVERKKLSEAKKASVIGEPSQPGHGTVLTSDPAAAPATEGLSAGRPEDQ